MSGPGPRETGETAPAARLGAELREARRSLGWEIPQLAHSLRIRQSYLEAIEAGRVSDLPGTTYAMGFVRAYAAALGLPAEEVARRFRAEADQVNGKPALRFPAPVPRRGVPAGALMLLGLLILAGAYGGWYWVTEHRPARVEAVPPIPDRLGGTEPSTPSPQVGSMLPATAPPTGPAPSPIAPPQSPASAPTQTAQSAPATPQPAASQPAPKPEPQAPVPSTLSQAGPNPAPPPSAASAPASAPAAAPARQAAGSPAPATGAPAESGSRIVLKATADAWLTVKQKSGPLLLNKLMHAGDSWPVPPNADGAMLTTGNAGGTEIDVDGAPISASLGVSGAVRRNLPLDADMLKSGKLPPAPSRTHPPAPPPAQ